MKSNIDQLYQKFLAQQCSPEEAKGLLDYFSTAEGEDHLSRLISQELEKEIIPALHDIDVNQSVARNRGRLKSVIRAQRYTKIRWFAYAAAIFVFATLSLVIRNSDKTDSVILPPGNKAILTLANGKQIALSGEQEGIHIQEGVIHYKDGTNVDAGIVSDPGQFVSLSTPKGGIYQVILSDRSKVWLNAGTTLRYPLKFSGSQRVVEVDGEAYFEVSENKDLPFVVRSKGQEIKVLGTAFNLTAFKEEKKTRTTLVRGLVELSTSQNVIRLYPEEEATLTNDHFEKRKVDPGIATSWREGSFSFDDEALESIMNKIARWYDVEVDYHDIDKDVRYFGWVSRYDNLGVVLNRLEKTGGIHFKVKGRRITVTK